MSSFADPATLPERACANPSLARNGARPMPKNLDAYQRAPHAAKPGALAFEAANELEALLVVAESARSDVDAYDCALVDLAVEIGDNALAELDGADVEAIARDVVARLRTKAVK